MEVSDTFVKAYEYYKRMLSQKLPSESPDFILNRVRQIFGLNDLRVFKDYVMRREEDEKSGYTDHHNRF